ncbi:MAG: GNAT family N-acetyltransferase [Actinobacteria bacterium]|nr:GNAT family N-acetyltransferase [Actinomycetota bacterium]
MSRTTNTPARPSATEITIDEARPQEYETIARLSVQAYREFESLWGDRWPLVVERLEAVEARAGGGVIMVARTEGIPVGTATLHPGSDPQRNRWPDNWAVLRKVAVAPDLRGRGIGRLLVEGCIDRAMSLESPTLALRTMEFMRTARSMYERMGFAYLDDFAEPPVLAMAKHLRPG